MNVVVTGASGGIGQALVEACQAEGLNVIGVDASDLSEADEHVVLDLTRADAGERLAEFMQQRSVKALVNNAAHVVYARALDIDVEMWDRMLDVNLRAPFLISQALYTNLRDAGGSIVNIGSVHAIATSSGVAAYAASKGGLVAMSRALAIEWGPEVRVNCVLPGAIDTEMLSQGLYRSGTSLEELGRRHPMGRVGAPRDVAEAVLYLMQAEFTTGATLLVDGGATARLSTE